MTIEGEWPTRSEVESVWRRVLVGELAREAAHDWARPWVEGADVAAPADAMAALGVDYLHGLGMRRDSLSPNLISHSGPGVYVLSEAEVAARLDVWLRKCREYDSDPEGFRQRARQRVQSTPEYRDRVKYRAVQMDMHFAAAVERIGTRPGSEVPPSRSVVDIGGVLNLTGPEHGIRDEMTLCGIARDEVLVMRHLWFPDSAHACESCRAAVD